MGLYPFSEFITAYLIFLSGAIILTRNPHEKLFRVMAYWLFFLFGGFIFQYLADLSLGLNEAISLMSLSDLLWYLSIALVLHSILIFCNHPLSKNKFALVALYLIPIISIIYFGLTRSGYAGASEAYFGTDFFEKPIYYLTDLIDIFYLVSAFSLCMINFMRELDINKKYQSLLFGFAILLPLTSDLMSEWMSGFFNFTLPPVVTPVYWASMILLLIAIIRFNLLPRYPEFAAKTIISSITDIFLIADNDNNLFYVNQSFLDLLGIENQSKLLRSTLSSAIGEKYGQEFIQNLRAKHLKEMIPVPIGGKIFGLNTARIKDLTGSTIGTVIIGRDITKLNNDETELDQTVKSMEKYLTDIDSLNRLMVEGE